jgi:hypothetical protein
MELLTISRMRAHRACARLAHLRYDLAIEPVAEDSAKARFGTLMHVGVEAWRLAKMEEAEPLAPALAAIYAAWLKASDYPDPFELARLEALMEGYHWRWRNEPWRVIAVETEFRASLRNPRTRRASKAFGLAGKIDAILADAEDRPWISELKTTTEDITAGSPYWRRLRLDGQISVYYDGAAALGYDVAGCLYDVARRPEHEPLKATPVEKREYTKGRGCKMCGGKASGVQGSGWRGDTGDTCVGACNGTGWEEAPRLYAKQRDRDETVDEHRARVAEAIASDPDAYYQRAEVVRLDGEIDQARQDVWQTANLIQLGRKSGAHPRNDAACTRFGSVCGYFPICVGESDVDDEMRFRRSATAHPELTAA